MRMGEACSAIWERCWRLARRRKKGICGPRLREACRGSWEMWMNSLLSLAEPIGATMAILARRSRDSTRVDVSHSAPHFSVAVLSNDLRRRRQSSSHGTAVACHSGEQVTWELVGWKTMKKMPLGGNADTSGNGGPINATDASKTVQSSIHPKHDRSTMDLPGFRTSSRLINRAPRHSGGRNI